MTDNKHAEAVAAAQIAFDDATFRDASYPWGKYGNRQSYYLARAVAGVAALNTRPDVEAMREACIKACEEQQQVFLSPQYATGQPLSSMQERFACGRCIDAIRTIPVPTGPSQ